MQATQVPPVPLLPDISAPTEPATAVTPPTKPRVPAVEPPPLPPIAPQDAAKQRESLAIEHQAEKPSSLEVQSPAKRWSFKPEWPFVARSSVTSAGPSAPEKETESASGAEPHEAPALNAQNVVLEPVIEAAPVVTARAAVADGPVVLSLDGLSKSFNEIVAVDGINLEVHAGSFYGIVGPNGAGKTTTLSMITGLLRPDAGSISVNGIDVWAEPAKAKRTIGVLPDRLRLFDRLTGAQMLYYAGVLRGLDGATVRQRVRDLAQSFALEDALGRPVTDYSVGMTKKLALAAAMIHAPRLLILDEPFESVDPVSAAKLIEILQKYVENGGTVVLSSHGMDLIQRVCDHVAIIVNGHVLAAGSVDEVRGEKSLEETFVELAGGRKAAEGMEWLHSFSG